MSKLYPCKNCGREVPIRSKGLCPKCREEQRNANGEKTMLNTKVHIPKITEKTKAKRKTDRKNFTMFFKKHINFVKRTNKHCDECGDKLKGSVDEVAHILSKSKHLELATNDDNVVYLCGVFSNNRCHNKFDSSLSTRQTMKVFELVKKKYLIFKDLIINKSNESNHIQKEIRDIQNN